MISFRINSHRFNLRAGAIALEAGHVLLHRLEGDTFWALPGGRVDAGEDGASTIVREFWKELGLNVKCNELVGVGENFFESDGDSYHELGLYFSVSLPIESLVRDTQISHSGIEADRQLEFKWFLLETLRDIDFRPAALRESLATGNVPLHFIQRG